MKSYVNLFLLLAMTVFVVGCHGDNHPNALSFYENTYEVPIHGSRTVGIKTGSGNYSLQVGNPSLVSASKQDGWSNSSGVFVIQGFITGETKLTVTDNKTGDICELGIKVIDNYETFRISMIKNEHPLFSKIPFLFFVNNVSRDVYFADMSGEKNIIDNGIRIKGKGSYHFSIDGDQTYLELSYAVDNHGELTDNTSFEVKKHIFDITKKTDFILHRLDENLNLGWNTPGSNFSNEEVGLVMTMKDEETGFEIESSLETKSIEIPPNILN